MRKNAVKHTEQTDALILRAYTSQNFGKGAIADVVRKTGITQASISRRASYLGVARQYKPARKWNQDELKVLDENAHKSLEAINRALIKAGFKSRSIGAIESQLRHKEYQRRQARFDKWIYSASELSVFLGVNVRTVVNYIKRGMLEAKQREGVDQPEYDITGPAIKRMLKNYTGNIDFTKIDKYWLVDLFFYDSGAKQA